jgi:hypothetical protein
LLCLISGAGVNALGRLEVAALREGDIVYVRMEVRTKKLASGAMERCSGTSRKS